MSMSANRLSFFYSFRGPSKTCKLPMIPSATRKDRNSDAFIWTVPFDCAFGCYHQFSHIVTAT